ncbi:MAG: LON peptidase substrate-binding domain-containing protein [Candidatus Binatia bacterium]
MDLPSIIPVFPLPNVVLFPGVPLPLHIFEPRYRDLVRDASASHEIIGMALLRGDWQRRYDENPDIFEAGCAGKIVNIESLPDGNFNIVLHGLREFSIARHIFDRPYRQAEVRWRMSGQRCIDGACRARLIGLLSGYLRTLPAAPAHRLLHDQTLSDDLLVNFFSYALEIAPLEKQGLLEAVTLPERAERLREILEFHLEESRLGPRRPGPDRCH